MRKLARVVRIKDIKSMEADLIELAVVDGWQCVVKKGEFKVGDKAVYFEIDSFLPVGTHYDFLSKNGTKKMLIGGKEREGYVLKTKRMRGEISQGLLLPITIFANNELKDFDINTLEEEQDLTLYLNIEKYEKPVPVTLLGTVKGNFPDFIPRTNEERIQNIPEVLEEYKNAEMYVTEKLDGTAVTFYIKDGEFGVCSRNLELKESEDNLYWQIARQYDIETKLRALDRNIALQGEIIGERLQGNPLKIKGRKLYIYNFYAIDEQDYFNFRNFLLFCGVLKLEHVPIINLSINLDVSLEQLIKSADGVSLLNSQSKREGIVVRSHENIVKHGQGYRRLSFKSISNEYLLEN